MLLIYTHQITTRIQFIFDLIIKDLAGIVFQLTTDVNEFNSYEGPKLSYTQSQLKDELFIKSVSLLFESTITDQNIEVFDWHEKKAFYKTSSVSALPFDVFAASFYLVSRYEEFLPHRVDEHERYLPEFSLAFQHGFLQQCLVNHYSIEIKKILLQKFPHLVVIEKQFKFISTIDVDSAYAYIGKGLYRTTGALARSLLKFNFNDLKLRINALINKSPDPYDTYSYYFEKQKQFQFQTIFFFLLGDFTRHDKNLPHSSSKLHALIKSVASQCEYGIHPSYASYQNSIQLEKEIMRLKNITAKPVTKSRQHFLKMKLPHTYQDLINAGITDDFTMGYAHTAGFRASICSPYFFFDLTTNECTPLKIHPFAVMDATLHSYMKLEVDDAKALVKKLADEVKSVNGTFISLWHNDTISETGTWKNWRNVFEFTIKYASAL